jgi:hypothetical protein
LTSSDSSLQCYFVRLYANRTRPVPQPAGSTVFNPVKGYHCSTHALPCMAAWLCVRACVFVCVYVCVCTTEQRKRGPSELQDRPNLNHHYTTPYSLLAQIPMAACPAARAPQSRASKPSCRTAPSAPSFRPTNGHDAVSTPHRPLVPSVLRRHRLAGALLCRSTQMRSRPRGLPVRISRGVEFRGYRHHLRLSGQNAAVAVT